MILYEFEQANISFMPIGRAPDHDRGPMDYGGKRFLTRQSIEDWHPQLWHRSWGIQVYTGIPSERDGAQWHDIEFKYEAICTAPDAVSTCLETLINAVTNPLLTMTKTGGIRFSCRIPDYLHPNTDEAKHYIYKHSPTTENPYQRDIHLEILGDKGYSRWDSRYEILHGNILDPPIIAKEVVFTTIDILRTELHEPVPFEDKKITSLTQNIPVAPASLGSHNLDLAKEAFLKHEFSYLRQENDFYYWTQNTAKVDSGSVLLWESDGTVWVQASSSDIGLPTNPTPITDIWDDTGILSLTPTTESPISEKLSAIREGKLSPLAIKRPTPVLHKQEHANKTYETPEKNISQIQGVFDKTARITGLIAETGAGKSYAAETYVLNGGVISLNGRRFVIQKALQRFQNRNLPPFTRRRSRRYLWKQVKEVPVEVRMATPFERGNICEDPERCDALEEKGGNPSESICPQCPVYTECQQRGYLSQPTTLQNTKAQLSGKHQLFLNPLHSEIVEEILKPVDNAERLCIIDEAQADELFFECNLTINTLERWCAEWQTGALGNFAKALMNTLEARSEPDDNSVRRIRTAMYAFQQHEEELIKQMCQVNVLGRVVARGTVDAETGKELASFTIEFKGGAAYIPLDNNAADTLTANGLPHFQLHSFTPNEDIEIPMSMTEAIQLGILDTETVESIQEFPTVYPDPNWTFWHQLKHFFSHYTRDDDAPMIWHNKILRFWMPPVLHPSVKRLLLMSATLSEKDIHRTFPDEEIDVTRIKPAAWAAENQVFQIRTDRTSPQTLLAHDRHWDIIGVSETGQRVFQGICGEIDRDPMVKHGIITNQLTIKSLQNIALKENVCFVKHFKESKRVETDFEEPEVFWIVGTPIWEPGIIWRQAQILFGNDEAPLSYETETEPRRYKDERVQYVYEKNAVGLLTKIVGMTGIHRLTGKKIILLSSLELPDITDRSETLLFDWEDFEVAGGIHRLEETIHIREGFETERANLNADTSREEVERVLGCSSRQANRVLQKLRGGNIQRVLFREQIFSLLATGEKRTSEIVNAIDGHPTSVRNELKRLVDAGDIVKVRWGIYTLPPEGTQ